MPRKAPDKVMEHRVTFGNKEREIISQLQEQEKINSIVKGVGSIGSGLGIVAIGGGLILGAYGLYQWVQGAVPTLNPINNLFGIKDRWLNLTKSEQDAFDAKNTELSEIIERQESMLASGTLTESQTALITKQLQENYAKREQLLKEHTEYQEMMSQQGLQDELGRSPVDDFLIRMLLG